MTFTIETEEEFNRLARKLVNGHMVKLKIEDEHKVVALLVEVFNLGIEFQKYNKIDVEL